VIAFQGRDDRPKHRQRVETARIKLTMHSTAESGTYGQGRPDTSHIKTGMPITKISSPNR
jgi:hypothetical protein